MTAGHGPTKAKQRFSSFLEKLGCSLELVAVYAAKMLELEVFSTGGWKSFRGPFGPPLSWELGVFRPD